MSLLFPAKWLRQLCSREAGSVSSRRSPFHCLQFYCRLPAAPRPSDLASPRDAPALPVTVAWSNTNTNHALATPFTHALPQQPTRHAPTDGPCAAVQQTTTDHPTHPVCPFRETKKNRLFRRNRGIQCCVHTSKVHYIDTASYTRHGPFHHQKFTAPTHHCKGLCSRLKRFR